MHIAGRTVAPGAPLFVVAELGLNHGGSAEQALRLVEAAAHAGATAVKLQSLTADTLVASDCPAPAHVRADSLRTFFRQFELDADAHAAVARLARGHGLAFISTPFDLEAVDLLESLDVDAYKIASGDITHYQLIERVAATGRPLIMSTGMSSMSDIGRAVACARDAGARDLALLHCVSTYPVPHGTENLAAVTTLANEFRLPVGLSDHGTDPIAAAMTVTLGGCIFEKHLVLEPDDQEIDAAVSATPESLATMIRLADRAHRALGDGVKRCLPAEQPNLVPSRRSLHARRDLRPGDVVTAADLIALRPGDGVDARRWRELTGVRVRRAIHAGDRFIESDIEPAVGGLLEEHRGAA